MTHKQFSRKKRLISTFEGFEHAQLHIHKQHYIVFGTFSKYVEHFFKRYIPLIVVHIESSIH
jgi:hypothetical protein